MLPFEWEGHGNRLREARLVARSDRANAQSEQLLAELTGADPACLEYQRAQIVERADHCQTLLGQHAAPETTNSDAFDHVVGMKHSFPNTLLPLLAKRDDHEKYAEMIADFRFIFEDWRERNDAMASNLARICAEHPGQRLVVVTGAEHRYALRDRLAARPRIALKEFREVPGRAGSRPPDRLRFAPRASRGSTSGGVSDSICCPVACGRGASCQTTRRPWIASSTLRT